MPAKSSASTKYTAPALEKGLDILETLVEESNGLTLSELALKLGRSMSEIFRMVQTLQRRGWLALEPGDRYRVSLHMLELAQRQHPLRSLTEVALPLMKEVSIQCLQSCHLSVFEAGRVIVVSQVDSPGLLKFSIKVGAAIGLLNTSSGHVLLAFQDAPTRQAMIEAHAVSHGNTLRRPGAVGLEQLIDGVRAQGFSCEVSEQVVGVTNLAFPILDQAGHARAALAIPFLECLGEVRAASFEQTQTHLRQAALQIAQGAYGC